MSSSNFPSAITGLNGPKQDCIVTCCYDYPRMNAPYLYSSEQYNCFFPASLHKMKYHIFQNISKFLIHRLIPFEYKNKCDLCNNILDKYKIGIIMVNKCSVLHDEVMYFFHEFFFHSHNRKI